MRKVWLVAAVALLSALPAPARAADCGALAAVALPKAKILSATEMPADAKPSPSPYGDSQGGTQSFCRIKGEAEPRVGFEVWLPENWNGRILALGSGGFGGSIPEAQMRPFLSKGYAVTANDTGHTDPTMAWMHDPVALYAWGHSATHAAIVPVKEVVRAYYGKPADYAYFQGCSTGGAQAMEEAEFYPQDFDGIAASCPGMHYSHLMLSFLWGLKASTEHAVLGPDKLQLLHTAVLKQCDALDGVKDGLLENPLACHFDPAVLKCRKGQTSGCLMDAEVATAAAIYQGPRNPRTGKPIYPGFVPGSESTLEPAAGMPYGWTFIQGPLATQYAVPLLQNMVFGDKWDWKTFDFDKDVDRLDAAMHDKIDATNPDLSAFQARDGKLLMVQGWGDPLNAQTLPIEYRDAVVAHLAQRYGKAKATAMVDGFFRLFMAPGMSHCMGGPGPSKFDALAALQDWVENGHPPQRLIAHKTSSVPAGSDAAMSRPLCPYPQTAHWTGRGATNDAANFSCIAPKYARGQ